MDEQKIILKKSNLDDFRSWVCLNTHAITWQGKNTVMFEDFWNFFFVEDLSVAEYLERFNFAFHEIKQGPLASWFQWLRDKFLVFVFIRYDVSIRELCNAAQIDIAETSNLLRLFFVSKFPKLESTFNDVFQIGNILSPNIFLKYSIMVDNYPELDNVSSTIEGEVMPSMEITLYSEWEVVYKKMKKELIPSGFSYAQIKRDANFRANLKILKEFAILLLIGVVAIFAVKYGNEAYEKYLTDKIALYEPDFVWLDKSLKFDHQTAAKEKKALEKEIPKIDLDKIAGDDVEDKDLTERSLESASDFFTETDVMLTSLASLPKDFTATELERSAYEETRSAGFRDYFFGSNKVYRVIINSVNSKTASEKVLSLLEKYSVEQADSVEPGIEVPGGFYYNLYVPRVNLKAFLSTVMSVDEATLYESRSVRGNPPGKNKLFIWIKTI